MNEHHHGIFLALAAVISGSSAFYLHNQAVINGTLYSVLLLLSIATCVVGLAKVRK